MDRYAAFEGTGLQLWLKPGTMEIFVKGKQQWVGLDQLQAGDVTSFGKVAFIGTEAEVREYRRKLDELYEKL